MRRGTFRALGLAAASAAVVLLTPNSANAAWGDTGAAGYANTTSGTISSGVQRDGQLFQWRARGGADPTPNHGIYLRRVSLYEYPPGASLAYEVIAAAGGNSMSYQYVVTGGFQDRCRYYQSNSRYETYTSTGIVESPNSYISSSC